MFFEVIDGGPATTIQDLGRPGYGAYGVPEGGAMDRWLVAAANHLAGNRPKAPALEFALKGPTLRWRGRMRLRCVVAGDSIREVDLAPGDQLHGEVLRRRAYGYVAVRGGFVAPLLLGGRGTCLPGGFGGLDGRELRRGDRLAVAASAAGAQRPAKRAPGPLSAPEPGVREPASGAVTARILPGDRRVRNSPSFHALLDTEWGAGAGNRVGLRLDGPALNAGPIRLSQPIPPGAVQVTGTGQPIVLLRDHPTIGGYPVVAVVAAADLDACAQLRLGDRLRFTRA
jgi:biotin-dependent carboxylase-like uncharacterized protein